MSTIRVHVGMPGRFGLVVTDDDGAPLEVSSPLLTLTPPRGATIVVPAGQLIHPSTGVYSHTRAMTSAGRWLGTYTGTVTIDTVEYGIKAQATLTVYP